MQAHIFNGWCIDELHSRKGSDLANETEDKRNSEFAEEQTEFGRPLPDPENRSSGDKALRARPVTGEIDHAALTKQIVARFPKILAALAK